jgi:hypothetical protein
MVQLNKIQECLDAYENKIMRVIIMFVDKYKCKNPTQLWRNEIIERTGYLDNSHKISYAFHGAGCSVEMSDGTMISFDFDENNNYLFDTFKFQLFIESAPEFSNEKETIIAFIDAHNLEVEIAPKFQLLH